MELKLLISCPQVIPTLINRCLPLGFKGIAYALLFASSATTLTGVWSAMSAMWIGDFLKPQTNSDSKNCQRSILITTVFAIISLILANTLVDSVFNKLILANIPIAALSFGLLAGFYCKKASRQGVLLNILMGCFCGFTSYYVFGEEGCYTWHWTVYGIPLTFFTGILGSLFFREEKLIPSNY